MEHNEVKFLNKEHFVLHAETIGITSVTLKKNAKGGSRSAGGGGGFKRRQEETHHPDGMPLFMDKYLYITFSSEAGCSFQLVF